MLKSRTTIRQRQLATPSAPTTASETPLERRLHYYHELDEWQQDNHFIRSGYVKETNSYRECLNSLTYLHNESVNIYSHLLPSSVSFWTVLFYINYVLTPYLNYLGIWEKLNFLQFALAATFCMFMSSTFHCLKSHSHKVCKFGNQLDYFGIIILITCSLNSVVIFAYYDYPLLRNIFVALSLFFGSICTVLTLDPKFATVDYRPFRSFMFILFGLSGVLPVGAGIYMFGVETTNERCGFYWLVAEGVGYISGALLYAARIPERFTHKHQEDHELEDNPQSGIFDIFGHSHQIFHVMVVLSAFCHWKALVQTYHYLHSHTLPNL
ncbi:ADIPOR-like receptor IZH1 [Candida viswanathii]|uniref:ADIPOR-like receptor IZH1 n=1 Tax=Candida viswanathii TaxID=5486 RepID=A0A367XQL0_9ASCO|nr:ADIPOR-like receptor IZH1 [Candida viswanathii]